MAAAGDLSAWLTANADHDAGVVDRRCAWRAGLIRVSKAQADEGEVRTIAAQPRWAVCLTTLQSP
jgi:hypothetical protein